MNDQPKPNSDDPQNDAADRLIDAALSWSLGGEQPDRQMALAEEPAPRRRQVPWAGLAAAAVVLMVVGGFAWRESSWGNPKGTKDSESAANGAFQEPLAEDHDESESETMEIPSIILDDPAQIKDLSADTLHLSVRGKKFGDTELQLILNRCPNLVRLVLSNSYLSDQGLEILHGFGGLRYLGLPLCPVLTDAGLATLSNFSQLRGLEITGFVGQVASIRHEAGSEEAKKYVDPFSKFSDGGLRVLAKLSNLVELRISGTKASGSTIGALVSSLPKLGFFECSLGQSLPADLLPFASHPSLWKLSCDGIIQENVAEIIKAIVVTPNLKVLALGGYGMDNTQLNRDGIDALASCSRLISLSLRSFSAASELTWSPLADLQQLNSLTFIYCGGLDVRSLESFSHLPKLVRLSLNSSKIGDPTALKKLANYPALANLNLRGTTPARNDKLLEQIWHSRQGQIRIVDTLNESWALPYLRITVESALQWNAKQTLSVVLNSAGRVLSIGKPILRSGRRSQRLILGISLGDVGSYQVQSYATRYRAHEKLINAANEELVEVTIKPIAASVPETKSVPTLDLKLAPDLQLDQVAVVALQGGQRGTVLGVLRPKNWDFVQGTTDYRYHFGLIAVPDTYILFAKGRQPKVMTLPQIIACEHRLTFE